jgi:hypothetical protein
MINLFFKILLVVYLTQLMMFSLFSKTYFLFYSQDKNEKIARECIDHLHSKDLISKDLEISTK